jgi:hypothetical protein
MHHLQLMTVVSSSQVCLFKHTDALLGTLVDAGVVAAAVATLQHNSPYCAAAAAGALRLIGDARYGDHALIEASGAIPALVRLIERPPRPGDPDLFCECVHFIFPPMCRI